VDDYDNLQFYLLKHSWLKELHAKVQQNPSGQDILDVWTRFSFLIVANAPLAAAVRVLLVVTILILYHLQVW